MSKLNTHSYAADEYTWGHTNRTLIGPDSRVWAEALCQEAAKACEITVSVYTQLKSYPSGLWAQIAFYDVKPALARRIGTELARRGFRITGKLKQGLGYKNTYSEYSSIPTGTVCFFNVQLIPCKD